MAAKPEFDLKHNAQLFQNFNQFLCLVIFPQT